MKLPFSFEEFRKNPTAAFAFLLFIAVAYLYVDNRINYTSQIDRCDVMVHECNLKVSALNTQVNHLSTQLRVSDSTLARFASKLEVLDELGIINK